MVEFGPPTRTIRIPAADREPDTLSSDDSGGSLDVVLLDSVVKRSVSVVILAMTAL